MRTALPGAAPAAGTGQEHSDRLGLCSGNGSSHWDFPTRPDALGLLLLRGKARESQPVLSQHLEPPCWVGSTG